LAVLAAAPVVGTGIDVLTVDLGLTGHAASNPWDSLPPRLRDGVATVLAVGKALALLQGAPGASNRIVDARIDLVLDCSIVSPTNSHG
jgi:hypothetical protein